MWELDCKEGWALKNWCFWTVVLEKTLESPLDCKEIQLVYSEGDQPWDFFGGNDAKAEAPVIWPPHVKCWFIGKDSDAWMDWGQEEKRTTEDEVAGWHHGLNEHEFEWTPGDGDGQGGLACCDSWGPKDSDMTEWLNWTEIKIISSLYCSWLCVFLIQEYPKFFKDEAVSIPQNLWSYLSRLRTVPFQSLDFFYYIYIIVQLLLITIIKTSVIDFHPI